MGCDLPPLVLLHGLNMTGSAWQETVPLLTDHHRVFTPTALGHRGGPAVHGRPVTIWDVIADAERYLDEQGLDRPHLAGNSMGGFVALELARRGRAASVCALSPGGFWSDDLRRRAISKIRRRMTIGRYTRPLTALIVKPSGLRRRVMLDAAWHGDRISAARALEIVDESLDCSIAGDIHNDPDEQVAPMDPLPCPITVAWAERDTVLPVELHAEFVRDRLPRAAFTILSDVGHVPMLDDPKLVAQTILTTTGAATPTH